MKVSIHNYETHQQASVAAAEAIAAEMRRLIAERGRAIGIFSGEAAQAELLAHLVNAEAIEWTRVIGFHTFELLGMEEDAPTSQRKFLLDHLVCRVPMAEFHGLRGEAANPEAVCLNYAELLKKRPPDFAVLGIGEGGKIGSGNCDIRDSATVKLTDSTITLTIPTLMACRSLFVLAPSQATTEDELSDTCPASILRTHPNAHFFEAGKPECDEKVTLR
ncbi:MAG: 6-phosphogluconolactonase [Acidobacteriota bacterium]|nr:6-phosphogluconolactonase [Acidobacteriota bacterium]